MGLLHLLTGSPEKEKTPKERPREQVKRWTITIYTTTTQLSLSVYDHQGGLVEVERLLVALRGPADEHGWIKVNDDLSVRADQLVATYTEERRVYIDDYGY